MNRLKLAYVKSSCYQDLWVSDKTNNYFEIFKTSMMRCPAIGLSEMCDTDYIIVKESIEYPSQHIPSCCSNKNSMKYSKKNNSTNRLICLTIFLHKDKMIKLKKCCYHSSDRTHK